MCVVKDCIRTVHKHESMSNAWEESDAYEKKKTTPFIYPSEPRRLDPNAYLFRQCAKDHEEDRITPPLFPATDSHSLIRSSGAFHMGDRRPFHKAPLGPVIMLSRDKKFINGPSQKRQSPMVSQQKKKDIFFFFCRPFL